MTPEQNARIAAASDQPPELPDEDVAGPVVIRVADVEPERVRWLWPARIPLGKLTVTDGDPALGKSTLMIDIAARVTTGSPMPGETIHSEPADVVLMTAEDGIADTVRPRADAAGANVERLHVLESITVVEDGIVRSTRPPSIPADLAHLEKVVTDVGARLVVVDVLNAYLGGVDTHKDQEVRSALMPLAKLAERTGCAVVVLRHLNKSGGANPLYRGGGSIGVIGAARSGLLVALDPEDPNIRVLASTKCNIAKAPESMAYTLVSDEERGCARVQWMGTTTKSATDLLTVARLDDEEDGTDAVSVLAGILEDGPRWVKEVLDEGGRAGLSKDQLKRAKSKLKIRSIKIGKPGDADSGWQWELPPRAHEGREGRGSQDPTPFAPLAHPSHESGTLDAA